MDWPGGGQADVRRDGGFHRRQPDPVEAIRYRMQVAGYAQADLGRLLGSRSRASEILARKRALTLDQAWRLHRE